MMMIIHKINSIPRREEIKKEAQEKSSINFLKEKKRKLMDREWLGDPLRVSTDIELKLETLAERERDWNLSWKWGHW